MPQYDLRLAGLAIRYETDLPWPLRLSRDYFAPIDRPDLILPLTPERLEQEKRLQKKYTDPVELVSLALLRMTAEALLPHGRLLMHGAALQWHGDAYLFTAPSGTGKTTHLRLWQQLLRDPVQVINGDKPFLHPTPEGVTVYGTPWAGKESWQTNAVAPLRGICLLKRGEGCSIRRVSPAGVLIPLMQQLYLPADPVLTDRTLSLLDCLLSVVPVYELTCDVSEDAVRCSFEAMTGEALAAHRK